MMHDVYEDTYYRTWYDIDRYHGFHSQFAQIEPNTMESVLKYPFNGANFSDRLGSRRIICRPDHGSADYHVDPGTPPQNLVKTFKEDADQEV